MMRINLFKKTVVQLTCILMMASCTTDYSPDATWVAELDKAGHNKDAVYLGGAAGKLNGIQTRAEAYALADGHKDKAGSFVGYIWDVKLDGNNALIEVIPNFSGESTRRCINKIESHRLSCMIDRKAIFRSSVTCHVTNWHKLDNATGGRIFTDAQTKWQRRESWSHVVIEGTISHAEDKAVKFGSWGGGGGSFGLGGGYYEQGFIYRSIHTNNCRVLTFRSKAISY